MVARLKEAVALLRQHLLLFSLIALTVGVPTNAFMAFVQSTSETAGPLDFLKIGMWSGMLLGPIWLGAMNYALARIKTGDSVNYLGAMARGFKLWGVLFAARFLAGLLVLLGLVALVVPGLILAVRYALIVPVVVLEDVGPSGARRRSTHLTVGRRWQILGSAVLFGVAMLTFSTVIYSPLAFVESVLLEFVLNCVVDVAVGVWSIVLFLFYWEAVQEERHAATAAEPEDIFPIAPGP